MTLIDQLLQYALEKGLIEQDDRIWAKNELLSCMGCDGDTTERCESLSLAALLTALTEEAIKNGICSDDQVSRDLFDTKLMGILTPRPSWVREKFRTLYAASPEAATDWYYAFSGDTNYIRRDRIAKDQRWQVESPYGVLDISINLSKPEKDPKAAAAARKADQTNTNYPLCALCAENEGYAGRMNHPARQNHRIIPLEIAGEKWYFQYSPYVYFNEHCILLSEKHRPMEITEQTLRRLLDFVKQFPHYFMGSNADLPIVGGSIQTHDHFQGGRYEFPMDRAEAEKTYAIAGYEDVTVEMVRWPLSVLRLRSSEPERLAALGGHILEKWRGYTDEAALILAETGGERHNTVTPIVRRRGESYELDLCLRNNLTTEEHPLGVYHPHAEIHHIKRETIGLIEVMGLAILPPRLEKELAAVKEALLSGADLRSNALTEGHAEWAEELKTRHTFTAENVDGIIRHEVGQVFVRALEHAGVYKTDPAGRAAFERFIKML